MVGSVGSNSAIAYARQAPAAMKQQATADAVQISVLKMANDSQGQAALQLIQAAITGKGATVNVTG